MTDSSQHIKTDPEADRWNYRPEGPVGLNPLFDWPPRPAAVLRWYRGAWLQFTSLTLCMALAIVLYVAILPPLEQMTAFRLGWILTVWAMNVGAQTLVAGTLHW